MKISIVIPVYNEAEAIAACLSTIAQQTLAPDEVIVVDNNSTDGTPAIARAFDFATVVSEPKQGVVHARTTGFDAARGDIIARIDADTLLPPDWTMQLARIFANPQLAATSGTADYYNVTAAGLFNAIDLFFRRRLSWQLGDRLFLWGANMAVRRSAWQRVKPRLCERGNMHEDYDLAIHLQEIGETVSFDERLHASVSSRRIDVNYVDFMRYVLISPNTYAQHHIRRHWHMYSVVAVCAVGYLPARILHRGYDSATGRFSWNRLFTAELPEARVDPTTNVA